MLRKTRCLANQVCDIFIGKDTTHIVQYSEFDFHLLFVLISMFLIFVVFAFRRYLFNRNEMTKNVLQWSLWGILTFGVIGTMVLHIFHQGISLTSTTILDSFFELDFLISVIVVVAFLFRVEWLFKMFVPLAVVFGVAFLIGTPGQVQSNFQITFDIFCSFIPLFILMTKYQSYSFREALLGVIFTTLAVLVIVSRNQFENLSLSGITHEMFERIAFYGIFANFELQVLAYIIAAIIAQCFVTICIGWKYIAAHQKLSASRFLRILYLQIAHEFSIMFLFLIKILVNRVFEKRNNLLVELEALINEKYKGLIDILEEGSDLDTQIIEEVFVNEELFEFNNHSESFSTSRILVSQNCPRSPSL